MLRNHDLWLTLPASDLERAKAFYRDVLGFEPVRETEAWLTFRSGASIFQLYPTSSAGTAQHTLAGWVVDDLEGAVSELRRRGVVFEEYDFPACTPSMGSPFWPASSGQPGSVTARATSCRCRSSSCVRRRRRADPARGPRLRRDA